MTITTIYPPIAAATVISAFLFALAWREHQREKREKKTPWQMEVGLLAYIAIMGAAFYFLDRRPLSGWLDIFFAALIGEAIGVVLTFGLLNAFLFTRGRPLRERAVPFVMALVMTVVVFAGLFA